MAVVTATYTYCPTPPAECWMLAGRGAGSASVTLDGVVFGSQLSSIDRTFEVTMEDLPAFALPTRRAALGGWWRIDRPMVMSVQVVMYNPAVFPANPSQWSQRLDLYAAPGEQPLVSWHGSQNGIHVAYATFAGAGGELFVHFPFTIDGL